MQIIDNINKTVKDDLQAGIHKGSRMSVAAACFSIYAYQELKKQLEGIDELRRRQRRSESFTSHESQERAACTAPSLK